MRKLFDRLTGNSRPAPLDTDEAEYYSTMFQDRPDEIETAENAGTWRARSTSVRAEPFDDITGQRRFVEVWRAEGQMVELNDAALIRLALHFEYWRVPAGQEVIAQDEAGNFLLVVLDGSVSVDRVQSWGGRARLADATLGDILGEMAVLDSSTRFTSCSTMTDSVFAVLEADVLHRLFNQEPVLALALMTALSRRLSLRLRQVSARLSALVGRT